jgi:tetratricopeptide (TPR) repeat protein
MATESAPASRNLWQLPTFLLGIAALVGVWYGRPYWQQTPAQRYERDLNSLRQALEKSPLDIGQVQTLLRKVHGVDPPANQERQAAFVIGSAIAAVAEATAGPDEADEQWKTARKLLERAQELGLPDGDKLRHRYRLARVWARTGEPPAKVIEALNTSLNCGDDISEGNRVLAEMYLKLEPPETKKARDCLKEYLAHLAPGRTEAQTRQLNQARLLLGDLHTRLGEPDDARKVLERIGPDAPPDVLVAARMQLAKSHQSEEDWNQAIRCLEQARDVRGISTAQKGAVLYQLAECYLKVGKRGEAQAAFDSLRKGSGPEAHAAALKLASVLLADPKKKNDVAQALEGAVADVMDVSKYQNPLMPLADARNVFEEAALKFRTAGAFEQSIRVARAYAKIADKSRDRELAAETLQAWGQTLIDQAVLAEPEERPRLVDEGTKKTRESAREWCQVATLKKTSTEKGEPLVRAADLYLKVGDLEEALKMLDELGLKVPDFPQDRLAEVWLKKGEVYLALGNREQARICFQNGIQIAEIHPSPTALLRCRIRLAEVLMKGPDTKATARAIAELEKIAGDADLAGLDKELHQNALLFIADANYQQKDYRKAEVRFRMFLDAYPDRPKAIAARFQLGQCYWFIAGQEADKCKAAKKIIDDPSTPDDRKREAEGAYELSYKQYMDWLKKAAEQFKAVETALLKGMTNPRLSATDAELLRKASLAAADCAFFTGDYEDCVTRYDFIASRYAGTVVQLEAMRSMWRCYQYYLQKAERALDTLTQMRTAFAQMPETEFDNSTDVRRRDYWLKWFDSVMPAKK